MRPGGSPESTVFCSHELSYRACRGRGKTKGAGAWKMGKRAVVCLQGKIKRLPRRGDWEGAFGGKNGRR